MRHKPKHRGCPGKRHDWYHSQTKGGCHEDPYFYEDDVFWERTKYVCVDCGAYSHKTVYRRRGVLEVFDTFFEAYHS